MNELNLKLTIGCGHDEERLKLNFMIGRLKRRSNGSKDSTKCK